jgi:radical SAM superfamily enzyme YgiQ (UPF0313 family)
MTHHEISIVFPPVTEARFFPYLSLPMITAYLRQQNIDISQTDLNLALCHRLLQKETLETFIKFHQEQDHLLDVAFRIELATYLLDHHDDLFRVFAEQRPPVQHQYRHEMRMLNLGIEMMLEGSILKEEVPSLAHIGAIVEAYEEIPLADVAAKIQYQMLEELLLQERPKLFAISLTYYSQILPSLLLAKWVKRIAPDTIVVVGGQQVMIFQEQFRKIGGFVKYVDCLGIGAGEETMVQLYEAISGKRGRDEVVDLIWLDSTVGNQINVQVNTQYVTKPQDASKLHIKDLPPPDFDGLPLGGYLSNGFQLALTTCVGCFWGRCAFCSYGNRSRMEKSYQQKTARQIANECQVLIDNYQVRRINFVDENTNLKLVLHAMRMLNEAGYQVEFSTRNRLEDSLLDIEFCKELQMRGCVMMSSGFETYSQRLLDLLDKGVTAAHYQQIIDNLHEVGIELRLSVMGGIPSETPEEAEMTKAFLSHNEEKIGIDVFEMLVAEPNTYLTKNPGRYGVQLQKHELLRGNQSLNYGMGRLGYEYAYELGDGYEQRLDWLMQIPEEVTPGQNGLNVMPRDVEMGVIRGIQLHPWVKVIRSQVDEESPSAVYVLDLQTENVFELADGIVYGEGRLVPEDVGDADMQGYLKELVGLELGVVVR